MALKATGSSLSFHAVNDNEHDKQHSRQSVRLEEQALQALVVRSNSRIVDQAKRDNLIVDKGCLGYANDHLYQ